MLLFLRSAQAKKAKNRAADVKSKAAKGKGKEKEEVIEQEESEEEGLGEEDGDETMNSGEDSEEEEETSAKKVTPKGTKTNYLDPALFASAAAFYEKESSSNTSTSNGKHDLKRKIRAEKQARALIVKERSLAVGQGGARDIG